MPWRQMERLVELECVTAANATWLLAWFDALPSDIPCPYIYGFPSGQEGHQELFHDDAVHVEWDFRSADGAHLAAVSLELGPGLRRYFWVCEELAEEDGTHEAYIEVTPETTARIVEVLRGLKAQTPDPSPR